MLDPDIFFQPFQIFDRQRMIDAFLFPDAVDFPQQHRDLITQAIILVAYVLVIRKQIFSRIFPQMLDMFDAFDDLRRGIAQAKHFLRKHPPELRIASAK